MTKQEAYTINS